MSNPISKLSSTSRPSDATDVDSAAANPLHASKEVRAIAQVEDDELEADTEDAASQDADESEASADESKGRMGLIALVLAVLLLGSIAINLKQSGDVASLELKSAESEQALGAAIERIDLESSRANGAEAALNRVDVAVDIVNERALGLQEALDQLREATVR